MRFNLELVPSDLEKLPREIKEQVMRVLPRRVQAEAKQINVAKHRLEQREYQLQSWAETIY